MGHIFCGGAYAFGMDTAIPAAIPTPVPVRFARGRQHIVGRVQPPQQPRGDLDAIEFCVRELPS